MTTLPVVDNELKNGLEMEKLQIFVHRTLGVEMSVLGAMDVVTFFQLVNEAEKIQNQQIKNEQKRNK